MAGEIRENQIKDTDVLSENEASSTTSGTSGAGYIGVSDDGGYYTAANVETVLQEVGSTKPKITTSTSTPVGSVTPGKVGDIHVDTTNDKVYMAYGTANTEWREVGATSGRYEEVFTASTTWTANHGLSSRPIVILLDSGDEQIIPNSLDITTTQAVAVFTSSVAGRLIAINAISATTENRYEESFSASTTWTATHGLGVRPVITLLDSSDYVIEPDTLQITTTQVVATFTSAIAGRIVARR